LACLAENALFALYDTMLATEEVALEDTAEVRGVGADPAEALRSLLAEALFLFDTGSFAAAGAAATAETRAEPPQTVLTATLWGETLRPDRHLLKTEVKAVTYHLLRVTEGRDGVWQASVILDV
jgi:SHS2 domain-containing protein